jgi:hypothetical protein
VLLAGLGCLWCVTAAGAVVIAGVMARVAEEDWSTMVPLTALVSSRCVFENRVMQAVAAGPAVFCKAWKSNNALPLSNCVSDPGI